jgi:ribosome-associated protein
MATIRVTPEIVLDESEVEEQFVRAGGPGGQHVNRAATAVQLRFDVAQSPSLPEDVRQRLLEQAGGQISEDGVLLIEASRYRSQRRNRRDARERLTDLLRQAAQPPKERRETRPTRASREDRLRDKRRQSETKRQRRSQEDW